LPLDLTSNEARIGIAAAILGMDVADATAHIRALPPAERAALTAKVNESVASIPAWLAEYEAEEARMQS
jgi:hypothetical protein